MMLMLLMMMISRRRRRRRGSFVCSPAAVHRVNPLRASSLLQLRSRPRQTAPTSIAAALTNDSAPDWIHNRRIYGIEIYKYTDRWKLIYIQASAFEERRQHSESLSAESRQRREEDEEEEDDDEESSRLLLECLLL